jgi:integrase
MKSLDQAVEDYLVLRRGLGFKLSDSGPCLHQFVSFLKKRKFGHITTKLALKYATKKQDNKPVTWRRELGIIRAFARYRLGADARTEIPPTELLRCRSQRAKPYLYSQDEIRRLLQAALDMKSRFGRDLKQQTHYCLFALLSVTGMRIGEAINLQPEDVNLTDGILTIRQTKFRKSRCIPLHPSTCIALRNYAKVRDTVLADRAITRFFMSNRGRKLDRAHVTEVFHELSRQIGIRKPDEHHGPRLHDFRHRFAILTLLNWYKRGEDANRLLPVLSTYLGHGQVSCTYWYLGSTPELLAAASSRIEDRWKGVL